MSDFPHSVEAEQSVLGSLLIDPTAWTRICDVVVRDDFYRGDHRLIFGAIAALAGDGKPADTLTVGEYLDRSGHREESGGLAYLGTIARDTPTAENVRQYAEIVRERSIERQAIKTAESLASSIASRERPIGDVMADAERQFTRLRSQTSGETAVTDIVRASDVELEQTQWLWPYWLASGELHIIAGAPGTGKTTIALTLAAIVSRGGLWPDGSRCLKAANALIWSGEDNISRTLAPRLKAAGADLERVHIVRAVHEEGGRRPFDPAHDMQGLMAQAKAIGNIGLLMVDPVVVAVAGDSHKNAETRRGLAPLVEFAHELGAAVIGVTHFSKGTAGKEPLDRVTGSLAFGALARLVFGASKRSDDAEARLFARIKSNLGPDGNAFKYTLTTTEMNEPAGMIVASRITWGDRIEGDARALLADAEQSDDEQEESSALTDAIGFLRVILFGGARIEATQIYREGRSAGHAERTVRRAQKELGIRPERDGNARKWYWRLPEQDGQSSTTRNLGHLGHLGRLTPANGSGAVQGGQHGQGGHDFVSGDSGHLAEREVF
jgi:energy-coupling factor transporter ATP-binding protein EcfA2